MKEFDKNAPNAMQVWKCYKKLKEEGFLSRPKGSGLPPVSDDMVDRVRETFLRNPGKSMKKIMSGNTDSYNDNLLCGKEMLVKDALQATG